MGEPTKGAVRQAAYRLIDLLLDADLADDQTAAAWTVLEYIVYPSEKDQADEQ